MKLDKQKRLAGKVLKVGHKRVKFNLDKLSEIKEAITKGDIRSLIIGKAIKSKQKRSTSRVRARKIILQKRKGRRQGAGSRKGKKTSRLSKKRQWMNKVRVQRKFIKELRQKNLVSIQNYQNIYGKIKGGFFRSKGHIKTYLNENKLFEENVKK